MARRKASRQVDLAPSFSAQVAVALRNYAETLRSDAEGLDEHDQVNHARATRANADQLVNLAELVDGEAVRITVSS